MADVPCVQAIERRSRIPYGALDLVNTAFPSRQGIDDPSARVSRRRGLASLRTPAAVRMPKRLAHQRRTLGSGCVTECRTEGGKRIEGRMVGTASSPAYFGESMSRRPVHIAFVAVLIASVFSTAASEVAGASGATHPTTAAPISQLRSTSAWEALFLAHQQADHTRVYLPFSLSSDSWDYYNLAMGVDANTTMYRATGKTQYLDRTLLYVNNVIAAARPSSSLGAKAFGDSYLGWVTSASWYRFAAAHHLPNQGLAGREIPLYESFLWRFVTDTLLVIRQTPALFSSPTYRAQYDRILAFTETNIFDKWYNRGDVGHAGGRGWPNMYRSTANMASHWAFISMDLSLLTQDSTRKARCITVYTNIDRHEPRSGGSSLRQQFTANPSAPAAYVWDSSWGPYRGAGDTNVQDVPHAGGVVAYIVAAHELGIEWTSADINALSHTLTDVILARTNNTFPLNVDGSGQANGGVSFGFTKLGRYSPSIQERLETYTGGIGDNLNATSDFWANGALNAKRLGV